VICLRRLDGDERVKPLAHAMSAKASTSDACEKKGGNEKLHTMSDAQTKNVGVAIICFSAGNLRRGQEKRSEVFFASWTAIHLPHFLVESRIGGVANASGEIESPS
jgi:hypothetical protein